MLSSVASQTESPALGAGVEYCFQLSLYFLVATGFAALASTGGLDVPSLTVMTAALALRGYFLAKRQWVVISERWTTPLTLAYFAFFAAATSWYRTVSCRRRSTWRCLESSSGCSRF